MKNLILTSVVVLAAVSSYGQGTVVFRNSSATRVMQNSFLGYPWGGGGPLFPVPEGRAELLWAPVGSADPYLFTPVGAPAIIGAPLLGLFSGGIRTIPGIPPGSTVAAMVRVWLGSNPSFDQAFGWGISPIFTIDTGNPLTTPPEVPGSILDSTSTPFTGVSILFIPEPGTASLLGCALLLALRPSVFVRVIRG